MGIWGRVLRRSKDKVQEHPPVGQQASRGDVWRVDSLQIGQATDIGRTRELNEDAFFTLKAVLGIEAQHVPAAILIVADGMGGHAAGQIASATAVRVAASGLVRQLLAPLLRDDTGTERRPLQEIMIEATSSANEAVSRIESDAGTTLTSVFIVGHSAYVAHVGDTRVYYLKDGEASRITQDHSLVSRLVELGEITAEAAQGHPQRNFLYRALGQESDLEIDAQLHRLAEGSYLLVCTDGLWNAVSDREMLEVVEKAASCQDACNQLVELANERGGDDNITVVLARINY
jgi:serine/threonine protein phosphatase PrpC